MKPTPMNNKFPMKVDCKRPLFQLRGSRVRTRECPRSRQLRGYATRGRLSCALARSCSTILEREDNLVVVYNKINDSLFQCHSKRGKIRCLYCFKNLIKILKFLDKKQV